MDSGSSREPAAKPEPQPELEEERVERVLTEELAQIETPEAAERVIGRLEQLAARATAGEQAKRAAETPGTAADAVESAAAQRPGPDGTAAALTETAAQVVAPTGEAPAAAKAASAALPPREAAPTPRSERGRRLLRDAMLRRMSPLQALDTRLFLAVNRLPHPAAANVLADGITVVTTGGWIWLLGLAAARLARVPQSRRAFRLAALSVIGATSAVEWPIKALFRRRRPFIDIVRALVIGRRPDGWSFPSGHSAAAFSGAWILSTVWPGRAPLFFALASLVGFSRIYVGAHYPGDVFSGAALGMLIAEAIRRPARRLVR
jgi:undecaprenyl-diphosphatase